MQPQEIDLQYLTQTTRARVYLLWAILAPVGFIATHFYQARNINMVWTIISVIGLGYMYKVMPLRVGQMRRIFMSWLVPIVLGMIASGAAFYVDGADAANFIAHLGAVWLIVMGVGYLLNGLVDPPSRWYWFAAVLNIAAGVAIYAFDDLLSAQYLIAAVVSAWSMLNLWIFRS
jgi:hypothetical protein